MVQKNGVNSFEISNGGIQVLHLDPVVVAVRERDFMSYWRAGAMQISFDAQANNTYFVRLAADLGNTAYLRGSQYFR